MGRLREKEWASEMRHGGSWGRGLAKAPLAVRYPKGFRAGRRYLKGFEGFGGLWSFGGEILASG